MDAFCTKRILFSEVVSGFVIYGVPSAAQPVRDRVAIDILVFTMRKLFIMGLPQSDPYWSYYVNESKVGRINLIEVGAES